MKKYVKCLDNTNGYAHRLTIGKEYEYDEKESGESSGPYRQVYIMKDDEGQHNGGNVSRFSEPYEKMDETTTHQEAIKFLNLKVGDCVKVLEKPDNHKSGNRGWRNTWAPSMDAAVGNIYSVTEIGDDSGVKLSYNSSGLRFRFPAFVLEKVVEETVATKAPVFKKGDRVKIVKKFTATMAESITWADKMDKTIGSTGKVVHFNTNGNVQVDFGDDIWFYKPESLELIVSDTKEKPKVELRVGNKVNILSKFDSTSGIHWTSAMNKTIGKTGTITKIEGPSNRRTYKVTFARDDYWYYPDSVLELIDEKTKTSSPASKKPATKKLSTKVYLVGDVVRITKNQSGGHSRDTVCEITNITGRDLYSLKKISIGGKKSVGSHYTHTACEFTKCNRPPAAVVAIPSVYSMPVTTTKFQPGDRVKIVKNTSAGFSVGKICTVERWSKDTDRYVLKGDWQGRQISQTHNECDLEFADAISPVKETTVKYIEVDYVNSIKSKKASDTLKKNAMYENQPIITAIQITQTVKDERFELNPYLLIG